MLVQALQIVDQLTAMQPVHQETACLIYSSL